MGVKFFILLISLIGTFSNASEDKCIDYIDYPEVYSSLWVEAFYETGRFSDIFDETWLINKNNEISAVISAQQDQLKELMMVGMPDVKAEQVVYMGDLFLIKNSIASLKKKLPYYYKNMELTEKMFIYKYVLMANIALRDEVKEKSLCLDKAAYVERLITKSVVLIKQVISK